VDDGLDLRSLVGWSNSLLVLEFIVLLDRDGNSRIIRPLGKPRVVDLWPGDWFIHGPKQKRYKLAAMSAYRQHQLSDELITAGDVPADEDLVAR
jgi:hypothetical protein